MAKANILSHVPSHFTSLRPQQLDILQQVERDWDRFDVFIINAPVACGKSLIATTIASWAGESAILTPNNILRNQYASEFSNLHVIRSKADYTCTETDMTIAKFDLDAKLKATYCICDGHKAYRQMKEDIVESPLILANYYGYHAFARYGTMKQTLIIDEAHNLNAYLAQFGHMKVWQHDQHYPNPMNTRLELMTWIDNLPVHRVENSKSKAFQTLVSDIKGNKPKYIYEFTKAFHGKRSKDRDDLLPVIKMHPVDLRGLDLGSKYMWPGDRRKVVLLSATISKFDIEAFGMAGKRVKYLEVTSPIPADRRPVILPSERRNMAFAHQAETLPHFAQFLLQLADKHIGESGLVHAPYGLARQIREHLGHDPRFLFHSQADKKQVYAEFLQSPGKILVASGMYEGISLNYDLCRWQVIAKVPFVSLAEPAVRYLASMDKTWYGWATLRDLLQASGRVCRSEDDHGITYIYDLHAERLIRQMETLTPGWFLEALHIERIMGDAA
jgi:ATP-dependent DNA helicase DinG